MQTTPKLTPPSLPPSTVSFLILVSFHLTLTISRSSVATLVLTSYSFEDINTCYRLRGRTRLANGSNICPWLYFLLMPLYILWFGIYYATASIVFNSRSRVGLLCYFFHLTRPVLLLPMELFMERVTKKAGKEAHQQWVALFDLPGESSTTSASRRRILASSFRYGRWWTGPSCLCLHAALCTLGVLKWKLAVVSGLLFTLQA